MLPKHLKAAGGVSSDGEGYDDEPDIEVISMPAIPKVQYRILLEFSRSSSEILQYRDPLQLLQEYVAEVSTAVLKSCLCSVYASDLT
jgi:hypothetical protein